MSFDMYPGASPTYKVIDKIEGTLLTEALGALESTSNYVQNDVLHTGIITFNNVFADKGFNSTELVSIEIAEYGTALLKPDLNILLFNDRTDFDITVTKNVLFDWGTVTKNVITPPIAISGVNGTDLTTGATPVTRNSYNIKEFSVPRILKRYNNEYDLKAILQFRSAIGGKFQAGATLQISIGVIRH